jgi:hypothetical protein
MVSESKSLPCPAIQQQSKTISQAVVLGRMYGMGAAPENAVGFKSYATGTPAQAYFVLQVNHAVPGGVAAGQSCVLDGDDSLVCKVPDRGHHRGDRSMGPGEERTFLNFPMQGNGSEIARVVYHYRRSSYLERRPRIDYRFSTIPFTASIRSM